MLSSANARSCRRLYSPQYINPLQAAGSYSHAHTVVLAGFFICQAMLLNAAIHSRKPGDQLEFCWAHRWSLSISESRVFCHGNMGMGSFGKLASIGQQKADEARMTLNIHQYANCATRHLWSDAVWTGWLVRRDQCPPTCDRCDRAPGV